jgi:UDP-glucose 4-epimerase
MKVLVTGGAGFIGSHIVDMLIQEGHNVAVVDNLVTGKISNVNPKAKFYEVDILHPQLDKVVEQEAPEVIIHEAALVYVQQSILDPISDGTVNALGTLNVLRSAQLHKVRKIIYASTCAVYGEPQAKVMKEEHPVSPMSFYGASKYMGEIYIRLFHELYNLDYTILRYANVYGPRQSQHGEGGVIPIFIQNMKKRISPTIFGDGDQTRDFIYVKDIAKANVLAVYQGSRQTFNIGTGVGTTVNDLYQGLDQIMRVNLPAQYKPERMGDVKHCCLNPSKAERELYWKSCYSLLVGLKETVQFYDT